MTTPPSPDLTYRRVNYRLIQSDGSCAGGSIDLTEVVRLPVAPPNELSALVVSF